MILADIILWLLVIAGSMLALTATWIATVALLPGFTVSCAARYDRPPLASVLIGALLGGPLVLMCLHALQVGPAPVRLISGVVLMVLVLSAVMGMSGLAARIGRGLGRSAASDEPWRQVQRGGWVLALTLLLPVVGWFLLLPVALLSGLGVVVQVCWRRRFPRHSLVA